MSAERASSSAHSVGEQLFDADFLKRLERLRLISRRMQPGAFKGEHRSRKRGSGIEFADYRPYVEGDSLRFVDWGAWLRFDKLLVRVFEEEEDLPIYLLLDCSASMTADLADAGEGGEHPSGEQLRRSKFGFARRLLGSIAYVGLSNLDRVTSMQFSEGLVHRLPTLRGPQQIHRVLDALASARGQGETSLRPALKSFFSAPRRRGLVVLVSDLFDADALDALDSYCAGQDLLAIRVLTQQEAAPLLRPGDRQRLRLIDHETGEEKILHLDERLLSAYRDEIERQERDLSELCRKHRWGWMRVDPTVEFDDVVQRIFKTGRLLR